MQLYHFLFYRLSKVSSVEMCHSLTKENLVPSAFYSFRSIVRCSVISINPFMSLLSWAGGDGCWQEQGATLSLKPLRHQGVSARNTAGQLPDDLSASVFLTRPSWKGRFKQDGASETSQLRDVALTVGFIYLQICTYKNTIKQGWCYEAGMVLSLRPSPTSSFQNSSNI